MIPIAAMAVMTRSAPTPFLYASLIAAFAAAGLVVFGLIPRAFGPAAAAPWRGWRRAKLALAALLAGPLVLAIATRDGETRLGLWSQEFKLLLQRLVRPEAFPIRAVDAVPFRMLGFCAIVGVALLMAVKLWEKWVNGRLEEAERQTGRAGIAAWIRGNRLWLIVWSAAIAIAYFPADGLDPSGELFGALLGGAIVGVAVLAAYPMWQTLRERNEADVRIESEPSFAAPSAPAPIDPHDAQQRVLRLLEEGRINAADAAELISALSASAAPAPLAPRPPMPLSRKLVLAGAAIVLVAFFLPWFTIRPTELVQQALGVRDALIQDGMPDELRRTMTSLQINGQSVPLNSPAAMEVTIRGGDVNRGLGWIVLAGALLAAAAPMFAEQLRPESRRLLAWASAGVASLLALYLLGGGLDYASPGLFLVVVGLCVQWAGLASALPRRPRPALAAPVAIAAA